MNINRDTYFDDEKNQVTLSSLVVSTYDKLPYLLKIGPNIFTSILQYWSNKVVYYSNSLYYNNANLITKQWAQILPAEASLIEAMHTSSTKLSFSTAKLLPKAQMNMIDTYVSSSKLKPKMKILLIDSTIYGARGTSEMGSNWGIRAACVAMEAVQKYKCEVHFLIPSKIQHDAAMTYLNSKINPIPNAAFVFEILPNMMSSNCQSLFSYSNNLRAQKVQYDRVLILDTFSLIENASSLQENHPFMRPIHRHCYTPIFFTCLENLVTRNGLVVVGTTTMNEKRIIDAQYNYQTSIPSTYDLIHAANGGSTFALAHIDDFCLLNSKELHSSRHRLNDHFHSFNVNACNDGERKNDSIATSLKLDDTVWRAFHFYNSYCEAALQMFKLNFMVLTFARPGCTALVDFNCTPQLLTSDEAQNLLKETHR